MDVLAANLSASLNYCPARTPTCSSSQFQSVPAAEDFGSETGESSSGLNFAYSGTSATASAGPFILRGLWGYSSAPGSAPGSTPVVNEVSVSGDPESAKSSPYVFAFFNTSASPDSSYEWAPDVPVWHLAPGAYHYQLMLADYAEQTGTLVVGGTPTVLSVVLAYSPSSGVYTPLWAFNDSELAGISNAGNGSLTNQFQPFNNPTSACDACGAAPDGSLSDSFGAWNDYYFPTFAGLLFAGTDAYVDIDRPVNFSVDYSTVSSAFPSLHFFLQIALVSTEHATLAHDPLAGGWPLMFGIETLAGAVPPSSNPFPQANVVLWNSSDDLVMSNTFVPAASIPFDQGSCPEICPPYCGPACPPPDGLLLFGGTGNTVWGNTFEDPTGPYAQAPPYYAGLAESESGDLIFNNNFSIDNPAVYLPFNIYYDSCPDGYAGGCGPGGLAQFTDTWNVTPQAASDVSATVNGVPLSGNILGSACAIQGGNFWSNYGNALNPYSLLPYANIYNYTDLAPMLPPGYRLVNRSIGVGGDDVPLTRASCVSPSIYTVSFRETGLTAGTAWAVSVDGRQSNSTLPWVNVTLPNGTYSYEIQAPFGYWADIANGSVTVAGANLTIATLFYTIYTVTFTESGLPSGTNWSVTLEGQTRNSSDPQIVFSNESNGTLSYSVGPVAGYSTSIPVGMVTVDGRSVLQPIPFAAVLPTTFEVLFVESGLPSGSDWSVTLGGTTEDSDGASNIAFEEVNGIYEYSFGQPLGYSANVTVGALQLAGHPITIFVNFTPTPSSNQTTSGGPLVDSWIVVGVAAAAVVLIALVLLLRYRRTGPLS
jgi:thermopsin